MQNVKFKSVSVGFIFFEVHDSCIVFECKIHFYKSAKAAAFIYIYMKMITKGIHVASVLGLFAYKMVKIGNYVKDLAWRGEHFTKGDHPSTCNNVQYS